MSQPQPSPEGVFGAINAFQKSAALKAAIELDVFTAIAEGNETASELARRCDGAERGFRILCDYLVISGFLTKSDQKYGLTPDSAAFLSRKSPAYLGSITDFLLDPMLTDAFKDLTSCVRKGGTAMAGDGSVETENPAWVTFARSMMPMMAMPAQAMAEMAECDPDRKLKLLDIAAGHGLFGISFAQRYPNLEVTALDWPSVLEVARENAQKLGVGDRYRMLPGDAFKTDFGEGYDLVLLTNFLHHFNPETNTALLKKVHSALADGGRAMTLEFVPNEDRVSPPIPAAFSLIMLSSTPQGDAYTYPELDSMMRNAGFARTEARPLAQSPQQVIVSYK